MLEPDYAALERHFKDAIGNLPNYKRTVVYEYVNALNNKITLLCNEIDVLANRRAKELDMAEQVKSTSQWPKLLNPVGTATRADLIELLNIIMIEELFSPSAEVETRAKFINYLNHG